jgi:hypothetical protein
LKKNRQEDDLGEVVFAGLEEMVLPLSQEEKERSRGLHDAIRSYQSHRGVQS